MLVLIMIPVLFALAAFQRYLTTYAPSNILIRHVRSSPARFRTALTLAALAGALLVAMHALDLGIRAGAPGWLNLVVLILAWDAIKIGCCAGGETLRAALLLCCRLRNRVPDSQASGMSAG